MTRLEAGIEEGYARIERSMAQRAVYLLTHGERILGRGHSYPGAPEVMLITSPERGAYGERLPIWVQTAALRQALEDRQAVLPWWEAQSVRSDVAGEEPGARLVAAEIRGIIETLKNALAWQAEV